MACTACGGFEFFTQGDNMTSQETQLTNASKCPSKDMMGNCLYTAQGVFVCNKDSENSAKGVANNVDMAREAVREGVKFNNAAPWYQQDPNQQILKLYP